MALAMPFPAAAGLGDAQIATDHPWYPGELAMSTFERLFETQTEQYRRATGREVESDEDKALAAWFFRNTHYAHAEEGGEDWWGQGFGKGGDTRSREYWAGFFSHGFGLCGTTHSQWTVELQALLGHGRARGAGTRGHNALEVWLVGGAYGEGRWALLDHDLSTVIFDAEGRSLLELDAVVPAWERLTRRDHDPGRQRGWLVCGLHPGDGAAFAEFRVAEYLPGYAGPPPMVHLRRGETLRRYLNPGLEDGETFVYWGRNYLAGGIPGPERSRSWVNQPEAMHGSREGTPHVDGQVRFANAVYRYEPNFSNGDYREGVFSEDAGHVTFEFHSPYLVAATPPNDEAWGIYEEGCRNGLVLQGDLDLDCEVAVSVDGGRNWRARESFRDGLDLTDAVKGHRHYLLRFEAGAEALAGRGLVVTTVCQAAVGTIPRLKDGGTRIRHAVGRRALRSAGPAFALAEGALVEGAFGTPEASLRLASPRGEPVRALHAAAHLASGNPPDPSVVYGIDYSLDDGETWTPLVEDWRVPRRGYEPPGFWSQSFCYGSVELPGEASVAQVRFANTGRRRLLRAEMHLEYEVPSHDALEIAFAWHDDRGSHEASHRFVEGQEWELETGVGVETEWVEMRVVPRD